MSCRDCQYFLRSEDANQRAFLEGFGYCTAAPDFEARARFFRDTSRCWLSPEKFKERQNGAG